MTETFTMRARVEAPLARVRHALTDAAALRTWLAEHAEVDLPHRYEFWGRYTPESDAPHQLADSGGKTRLTFVQSGFDEKRPPYGAWMGWLSGLAELRRFHELRPWRRVWLDFDMSGLPDGMLATD